MFIIITVKDDKARRHDAANVRYFMELFELPLTILMKIKIEKLK